MHQSPSHNTRAEVDLGVPSAPSQCAIPTKMIPLAQQTEIARCRCARLKGPTYARPLTDLKMEACLKVQPASRIARVSLIRDAVRTAVPR